MSDLRRNIELKFRCDDLEKGRRLAELAGAKFVRRLEQIDTYFHVSRGRLKLRQTQGASAELIWYGRLDAADFRDSHYLLMPIAEPQLPLDMLTLACGVRARVEKKRDLLLLDNIRIHLDQVQRLGTFIEFEAVIERGISGPDSRRKLDELHQIMRIDPKSHCADSYGDMIEKITTAKPTEQ